MKNPPRLRLRLVILALAPLLAAGCGDDADDGPMQTANPGAGSFRLLGSGYDETIDFSVAAGNHVFCRQNGEELWVRLAEGPAANGETSKHIDLDLCNYSGSGTFTPMDPRVRPCPGGLTWDIWWHDGPDVIFLNQATSAPCQLIATLNGEMLTGTFSCASLEEFSGGPGRLDVQDGTFRCEVGR